MRATSILLLGAGLAPAIIATQKTLDPTHQAAAATLLFVQSASGVSYDGTESTLTLEGVSPVVTFFTDRPKRIAGHVLLTGFVEMWGEGEDSFDADPPNAAVSIIEEGGSQSAVVTLFEPRLSEKGLTYRVKVLEGALPEKGGATSLFIDGLLFGAGRGAALGAIGGAIAGNAGKGAEIGAAVGATASLMRGRRERVEAQEAASTTVINVQNSNGSFTPVTLHLVPGGWKGPRGEIYPTLPTEEQLKKTYGM